MSLLALNTDSELLQPKISLLILNQSVGSECNAPTAISDYRIQAKPIPTIVVLNANVPNGPEPVVSTMEFMSTSPPSLIFLPN